jgi:hypothetical protein
MPRFPLTALLALPVAALVFVPACVGDDAVPVGGTVSPEAGGGTDAFVPTPGTDGSTGTDSGVTCATGMADCDGNPANGCEVDTRTSATNCGACAKACGGTATCSAGDCSVERVKDALDHPFALEIAGPRLVWYEGIDAIRGCTTDACNASTATLVDISTVAPSPASVSFSPHQIAVVGPKFYFTKCMGGDCRPAECDVTGCKNLGAPFVTPTGSGTRHAPILVGGPGAVYTHHGLDGLIRTDLAAKTESFPGSSYKLVDQLGAMHIDAQRFVYVDPDPSMANPIGGVYVCPIAGCVGARTPLLPPPVKLLAVGAGTAFTSTGGAGASAGVIYGCPLTGCGGGGTVFAQNQAFTTDIAADDKAVYWTTAGSADVKTNNAAIGTVMRCSLPGCAGGPVKIGDAVTNPVAVRVDANYVYWITYGTPANKDGAIFRKRR